jgi:hypothetical protein
MSRRLGIVVFVLVTVFAAAPSFAQEKSKNSPGTMATIARADNQNRATCRRQAREQKIGLLKRRAFMKECMKR